ncbi:LuxR C-terminal-related transcriptional regulator [Mangrovicella endophytica]|uniref:LuxR C-terminal-related transcriptional regulator n=1 Tax=Mangrovicella endophytica TaxID=2066697 RepID=UPI001FE170D2|nr:LuxR C-terminal-related transcriptional regulator [Mangrovicella endophytica]
MAAVLLQYRLVLVHAPAGSGKTTLLSQWHEMLAGTGVLTVWYSTNDADGELLGFGDGLIRAIDAGLSRDGDPVLSLDGRDALSQLIPLLSARAAREPITLFIDDYHLAEAGNGADTLNRLLAARIPQLTIVLASRNRPAMPVSRLRVSGELLEVPVEELFFSEAETEDFFRAATATALSAQESRQMHRYTEGWAAGLRLAALVAGRMPGALSASPTVGSHRAVAEYFLEEVILGLPEEVYRFLTMTSILDTLSAGLCNAVTGRSDGGEMLSFLEEAQLFLSALPGSQRWYKYHHLFQEFLQARLYSDGRDEIAELHSRAAQWFIANTSPMDAVRHAFLARKPAWAAELIEDYCLYDYLSHGRFEVFSRWMQQLPRGAREERPLLLFLQVWRSINLRRFLKAEQTLRTIEQAASDPTSRMSVISRETGLDIEGRLHLMRALIGAYGGDLAGALGHIEALEGRELDRLAFGQVDLDSIHSYLALQVGDLALAEKLTWRAKGVYHEIAVHWGGLHSRSIAAMCYIARGLLHEAEHVAADALRIARTNFAEHSYMVALPSVLLGIVAFDRGEFLEAERLWERAIPPEHATDVSGLCERILFATIGLVRLHDVTGCSDKGTNVLVRASRRAYEAEDFRLEFQLAIERADRAFRLANPAEGMREWERLCLHLPEARRRFPASAWQIWDAFQVVEARMLIEAGNRPAALATLGGIARAAHDSGRLLSALQVERLLHALEGTSPAPHAELGCLLDVYLPPQPPSATAATAARRLPDPVAVSPEGLTAREDEVLALMQRGLSNKDIAARLDVNINTVKSHIRNIFSKLGVNTRTQAVLKKIRPGLND